MKKSKSKKVVKSTVKPTTKSGHRLTPQQELFCQLYAGDREFLVMASSHILKLIILTPVSLVGIEQLDHVRQNS